SQYGNKFAIKAIKGGEHEAWGTYNYLSFFSNNGYLEFLGIDDLEKAKDAENPLIQHLVYVLERNNYGAFQFALRTKQLDQYVTHFEKNNIAYHGPYDAQRQKPDGTILKWRMLFPEYNYESGVLPFLIEWEDTKVVFSEANLAKVQNITKIKFGGITKEDFSNIYKLKIKKFKKYILQLLKSKIYFNYNNKLRFNLA